MVVILKRNTSRAKLKALLQKGKVSKSKGFDALRFNGALPLKGDPLKVQRALRNEWS